MKTLVVLFVCGGLCGPAEPLPPFDWDCDDDIIEVKEGQ